MQEKESILKIRIIPAIIESKNNFILKHCDTKDQILDVGCIGQAIDYESDLWLHGVLVKNASNVLGVDINKEKIKEVNAAGFQVCDVKDIPDEQRFDAIVMGDIIEHISDVNSFLNFYKGKLKPGGKMIITTPNPFSFRQLLNILFFKRPFINEEHTCFIDPYNIIEVLDRAHMELSHFSWIHEHAAPKTLTSKLLFAISRIFYSIRKYYSPNFGIVCTAKSPV